MDSTITMLTAYGNKADLFQLNANQEERLKMILLEMCEDIFTFCEQNNLCCMLGGGSALGAVRHKGFIPWDDDVDLNMPRCDYNKFATLFSKNMNEKYEIFVPDGNHRVTHLFMKVSLKGTCLEDIFTAGSKVKNGISIDIFPIESVPNNRFVRGIKGFFSNVFAYSAVSNYIFSNRNSMMRSMYCQTTRGKINFALRCVLGALLSAKPYEWWYCKFNRFIQTDDDSKMCTIPTGRKHYKGEMCDKTEFFPTQKATFEGKKFEMPNKVNDYLTRLYGDYMELPPVEKRERHFCTALDFGKYGGEAE